MEEILIPISFFGAIFGIVYLYLSTRNKERLALIEKGADASIFMGNKSNRSPMWKVLLLNLALLLMAIGIGVLLGLLIQEGFEFYNDAIFPGIIFFMSGLGLLIGFNMTKNLDKE